jgi:L-threonylcarbamoyladenylate synthase
MHNGRILAYPTEAVWGLGCDPLNPHAVETVLALKGRSKSKGLILIAADIGQIEPFIDIQSTEIRKKLLESWPGPVTWIVPATHKTPPWLKGKRGTLAVRVTAHPAASALCRVFGGAIVSTSANPSGARPALTLLKTRLYFTGAPLDFLPGKLGELDKPTAIFDACSGNQLR